MKFILSILVVSFSTVVLSAEICNIHCDGRDPDCAAVNPRQPVTAEIFGRQIVLHISDSDDMAFASIDNGDPGDELWLDRSFDGGASWAGDSQLGYTKIPEGSRGWRTLMFNVDNPSHPQHLGIGAIRACGSPGNLPDIACTEWARSTVNAERPIDAAATAIMQFFNEKGIWQNGWWTAANVLTSICDYARVTGVNTYNYAIDTCFEKNKNREDGNFTNNYIDDTLWWGLAWVRAYDVLGDPKYLNMSRIDADYSYRHSDNVCGGGVWWTRDRKYKNAITNELFIKLAAALHNRIPGDEQYLHQATEVWTWFRASGMFNSENLINDGLNSNCQNNAGVTWTYNQGVILGALVELHRATGDAEYLREGQAIADAVIRSNYLNPNGVLTEPCEGDSDCGRDGPSFKGAFVRGLGELDRALEGRPYKNWLIAQTETIQQNNRNSLNQFGLRWRGPVDKADHSRQHSAFDAFIAAY